jgi:hypothetical protein
MTRNARATPRDIKSHLLGLKNKIEKMCERVEEVSVLSDLDREKDYDFNHILRRTRWTDGPKIERDLNCLIYPMEQASKHLSNCGGSIDAVIRHGYDFLRYAIDDIDSARKDLDEPCGSAEENQEIIVALMTKQEEIIQGWNHEVGEEFADTLPFQLVEYALSLPKLLSDLIDLMNEIQHDLSVINEIRWGKEPKYESAEILYHASVKARQLLEHGFDLSGAKEMVGLGQFGRVLPVTSFTSSEWLGIEIAKVLYDFVLIARGDKTYDDLVSLAAKYRVFNTWVTLTKMVSGDVLGYDADEMGPVQRGKLCKWYSHLLVKLEGEHPNKFTNPLIVYAEDLAEKLKNMDPRDVGTMACKVDLTSPLVQMVHGLDEYRVPAESILACTGVYFPAEHGGGYL